jgi:DNA (cytosine-5)-methyltransferase 1
MRHASLFSGIGGPEIAAAMMGWDNVFHCEINPFGRQILNYWFPNSDSYEDITKTDFKQYRGSIDVLTGGFPCQPFSLAGKRKGHADDRYLWPEMLRAIDQIRPTWVIGENVAGITTMVEPGETTHLESTAPLFEANRGVHRFRTEHTFTIERICRDLEQIGYSVQPLLVPACAVGAPHRRDRIFILAYNVTDPDIKGLSASIQRGQNDKKRWKTQERYVVKFANNDGTEATWWDNFPSVSPVHRGNDGLPFDVDNLTIPFSKWRTESLKAYGNAIVPQVMYRIFQCIEQLNG